MLGVIYNLLIGVFGAIAFISFIVISILLYVGYETNSLSLLRIDDPIKDRLILFFLMLSFSAAAFPNFNSGEDVEVKNIEKYNETFSGFARTATSGDIGESDTVDYDNAFVLIINPSKSKKLVSFVENKTIIEDFITKSYSKRFNMIDVGECTLCDNEINDRQYMVFEVFEPYLFGLVGVSTEQESVCSECMSEYMLLAIQKEEAPFTENDLTAELL